MTNQASRETKEVKTTSGHVFVFYTYITGRDKRAIEGVYLNAAQISTNTSGKGGVEIGGVSGSVNHLMQNEAIKSVIKWIRPLNYSDEALITESQAIIDFVLDLPETEYEEVLLLVNEITEPKKA